MESSDTPSAKQLQTCIDACIANGEAILDDTVCLEFREREATRRYLAVIAQEEFAKAFLLYLVREQVIPWSKHLLRAMSDHACKHLVGAILDYLNPPSDETYQEMEARIRADVALGESLPAPIADAISMLRYEKIGRWESSGWSWEVVPDYDPAAKRLAEGKRDRIKQDSLYVRIGSDGRIISTPEQTATNDCKAELERAESYACFLKSLAQGESAVLSSFEKTKKFIELLFAERLSQ